MGFTKLNYQGFEEWLIICVELENRLKYEFWFDNNYGASVVKQKIHGIPVTYGAADDLFEVMVLYKGEPCHSTHIADDVIGHCLQETVIDLLKEIQRLEY
jgi:hypothetical protein